ncbi:importin subunit alpha [Monosporozyma servazzii]
MGDNKFIPDYRRTSYKNRDRFNPGEIRRRRDEFQVKLRKERQYQLLEKRRFEDTSTQSTSSSSNPGESSNIYDSEEDVEDESFPSQSLETLQVELTQWETTLSNSYDLQEQLAVLVKIRQSILENDKLTLNETTIKIVFKYLQDYKLPMLQYEALWVINNLTSGDHSKVKYLIKRDIINILFTLLESGKCDFDCQEHVIWIIGNIAGDCSEYRKLLCKHEPGVINLLVEVILMWDKMILNGGTIPLSLWRITSWTLSNVLKSFRMDYLPEINVKFITILKTLLKMDDIEVLSNTCWALSYLNCKNVEITNGLIINSEILPQLARLLPLNELSIIIPCLKVIGNITSGTDEQTQYLVDINILPTLKEMLTIFEDNEYIIKQILWNVSNIVAGTKEQFQSTLQQNIIPKVVAYLLPNNAYMIRREACWVICNIISRHDLTSDMLQYMILQKFITPLYRLLNNAEPALQNIILSTFEIIFKFGMRDTELNTHLPFNMFSSYIEQNCGTDILLDIQVNGENDELVAKASHILDSYFDSTNNDIPIDSKEASLNPKIEGNRFKFEY